ncbi:DUF397 domain-containing protein [Streptomyces sp. C10-9-1]|uniref:DUF397 domain-containing protein n=1 Tax=Streptomyces sp. C10-9-1 TaxID=1859285 RepID=UPI003D74F10A
MHPGKWQTSSYCGEGDACVNVTADMHGSVLLTESSDPDGAILHTTPEAFAALTHALRTDTPSPHIHITRTPDGLVRLHHPHTPEQTVTTTADKWHAFTLGVLDGEFDHLGVRA